jgi:peptidoglycan/LPS O-acetylase OafA/YrhL
MTRFNQQAWRWVVFSSFLVLGTVLAYSLFTQEITPFYRQVNNPQVAHSFSALIYMPLLSNFWLFLGGMSLNWLTASVLNTRYRKALLLAIGALALAGFVGSSYLYRYGFVSFEFKLFRLYAILMPLLAFPVVLLPILLNDLQIPLSQKGLFTWLKPFINTLESFGHLSYGIYLWHFPLIIAVLKLMPIQNTAHLSVASYWVVLSSVSLILTLVVSAITYRYIEQPIERIKKKRSVVTP